MVPDYPNYSNAEAALIAARYRGYIQEEARHQTNVVRGCDKMSRCIVLKLERRSAQHDQDTFFIAHLYLLERAIATTEVLSEGREEKCLGMGDFGTYQSAYAPSRQALMALIDALQRYYPERLKQMILLDPPLWMRALYSILRVFLRSETREKIVMVSGMVRCAICDVMNDAHRVQYADRVPQR
jgi:CRAL/TRIO domain